MNKQELGGRIQALRKKTKMTQEELAEKADIALRVLQRIERGTANPKLKTLDAIAEALGSPLDVGFGVKVSGSKHSLPDMKALASLITAIDSLDPMKKQLVLALIYGDESYISEPALRRVLQVSLKSLVTRSAGGGK